MHTNGASGSTTTSDVRARQPATRVQGTQTRKPVGSGSDPWNDFEHGEDSRLVVYASTMRIFISWSGDRSRVVAEKLAWLIRNLIQTTEPWVSTAIDKGSRWEPEIARNLDQAGLGIVCITSDNQESRWLLFEAGALAKRFEEKVCTFLLDVAPAEVAPPLGQFQHTIAEKADVWALIQSINKTVEAEKFKPRPADDLESHFKDLWPKFEDVIAEQRAAATKKPKERDQREMLTEVLNTIRAFSSKLDSVALASLPVGFSADSTQGVASRLYPGQRAVAYGNLRIPGGLDLEMPVARSVKPVDIGSMVARSASTGSTKDEK